MSQAHTLFISDLHLCQERTETTGLFLDFLENCAPRADQLYILGDLFEAWLGDDTDNEFSETIISALNALAQKGTAIAIMHGNRDFLLGQQFADSSGSRLIDDPTLIQLDQHQVLLSHGDELCTDDVDYQAFRKQVRNPDFQRAFLALSMREREQQAHGYRELSKSSTQMKAQDIMDVNQMAVHQLMADHKVDYLIHGHTHRPAIHHLDKVGKQRIVLGDWGDSGSVLIHNQAGFQLSSFNQSTLADICQTLT